VPAAAGAGVSPKPNPPADLAALARWAAAHPDEARLHLRKAGAERSLVEFVKLMWPVLEPGRKLVTGWALEAVASHLEAVTAGRIRRLLINIPPGSMKPEWVGNLVATRRGRIPLGEVAVGDEVLTHRGRYRRVLAVHEQGVLPLLRVETFAGRVSRAAADHPYLTPRGWRRADELRRGDTLAAVRPDEDLSGDVTVEEARVLGYLVGDGSLTTATTVFTNSDPEVIADFERCCEAVGLRTSKSLYAGRTSWTVRVLGSRGWVESFGLTGKNSYDKFIPNRVLASSREVLSNFLGAYWASDGNVYVRDTRQRGSAYRSSCTTVSKRLADDVQHALLRLGIRSSVRRKVSKIRTRKQGDLYVSWTVSVVGSPDLWRIAALPGLCARKRLAADTAPDSIFERVLYEDEVESVELDGEGECRCLTVEEDASFTVGDVAVHNSLLCNVFWPAWEWGPRNLPHMRYMSSAYSEDLTIRDNGRCLRLVQSEVYQKLWGERVKLESFGKEKFGNSATGWRFASSVKGTGTGERGDRVILDDLLNAREVASEAALDICLQYFTEVIPSRTNDASSAIILIMQRLHDRDPAGHILEHGLAYDRLILPMRHEPDHPYPSKTSLGFVDPRTEPGELFWPERFPPAQVDELEKELSSWGGDYAISSQLQQRPVPRGGGMFKRDQILRVRAEEVPVGRVCRAWDLAASKDGRAAYTVGARMSRWKRDGRDHYTITDIVRGRWGPGEVRMRVREAADGDPRSTVHDLPQDPGQAGLSQKADFAELLAGYDVRISPETGSKEDRARPLAAQVELGNVSVVEAPWTDQLLAELGQFPAGTYKDQVDALSRAFARLVRMPTASSGAAAEVVQQDDPE